MEDVSHYTWLMIAVCAVLYPAVLFGLFGKAARFQLIACIVLLVPFVIWMETGQEGFSWPALNMDLVRSLLQTEELLVLSTLMVVGSIGKDIGQGAIDFTATDLTNILRRIFLFVVSAFSVGVLTAVMLAGDIDYGYMEPGKEPIHWLAMCLAMISLGITAIELCLFGPGPWKSARRWVSFVALLPAFLTLLCGAAACALAVPAYAHAIPQNWLVGSIQVGFCTVMGVASVVALAWLYRFWLRPKI